MGIRNRHFHPECPVVSADDAVLGIGVRVPLRHGLTARGGDVTVAFKGECRLLKCLRTQDKRLWASTAGGHFPAAFRHISIDFDLPRAFRGSWAGHVKSFPSARAAAARHCAGTGPGKTQVKWQQVRQQSEQ
jgi:hypothetical protein